MSVISDLRISRSIRLELDWRGFSFLEQFRPEIPTLILANELGQIDQTSGIPAVQRLTPTKREEKASNFYSGNYGLQEFPLHTDLAHWYIPPRYLILRCVVPAPLVYTTLVDFFEALTDFPESTILHAQFFPRRKVSGKRFLLRFFQKVNENHLFRWDNLFIAPANREAREVSSYLNKFGVATSRVIFAHQCDTLIIDNWRVMHGRSTVPYNSLERSLERVYLREIH